MFLNAILFCIIRTKTFTYQYRPSPSPKFVERTQSFVLRHLPVERNSHEAEVSQDQGKLQGPLAGRAEDDERVAGHLVDQVDQVHLLELEGDEEVILHQLVHRLVLGRDFNLEGETICCSFQTYLTTTNLNYPTFLTLPNLPLHLLKCRCCS